MRLMAPVTRASWLSGDFGRRVESELKAHLRGLAALRVVRVLGGFVVQADESENCLVYQVAEALRSIEAGLKQDWPTSYHELGPLFTGHVQVVLDDGPWETPKALVAPLEADTPRRAS